MSPDDSLEIKKLKGSRCGKPVPTDAEILQMLPEQGSEVKMNYTDLVDAMTKCDYPRQATLKKVNALADANHIIKIKDGKSTNYFSVKDS